MRFVYMCISCFNTQPPEGGWVLANIPGELPEVSTHSRPKAAGGKSSAAPNRHFSFNTQPPEGGWEKEKEISIAHVGFNTQPPEGGWFLHHETS